MSYSKYYLYKHQYSDDGGTSWSDVQPEETVPSGDPIGHYSTLEECEQATPPTEGYLAIIPRGNGNIQLSGASDTFQYSFNSGATWNNARDGTSITMNDGVPLWFKGTLTPKTNVGIGRFIASTDFDVEGNPSSLIYGEDFSGKTTVPNYAFSGLFSSQPVINASGMTITAVSYSSCNKMFYSCKKLVSVPQIQTSQVEAYCFLEMFTTCESLVTVPTDMLPATTLALGCYWSMFKYCSGLTNAPALPATTLANYCYSRMFQGCTLLNSITCLARDVSATNCTEEWVNGVAANGTFTKAQGFQGWSQGVDGIPDGWTVEEA